MSNRLRKFQLALDAVPLDKKGEYYAIDADIQTKLKYYEVYEIVNRSFRVIDGWKWIPIPSSVLVKRLVTGQSLSVSVTYKPLGLEDL